MSDRQLPLDTHPRLRAAIENCDGHIAAIEKRWSLAVRAQARMGLMPGVSEGFYSFDLIPTIGEEFFEQFAMTIARVFQGEGQRVLMAAYQVEFLVALNVSERYENILRTLVADNAEFRCFECGEMMWEHSSKGPCQKVGCFCQEFRPGRPIGH